MRGKPDTDAEALTERRSIPACAGEAPSDAAYDEEEEVYPRVCGGSNRWLMRTAAYRGLSPRVRGKRLG